MTDDRIVFHKYPKKAAKKKENEVKRNNESIEEDVERRKGGNVLNS